MIEPRTLKGFRDFLPLEAKKRQYVIQTMQKVFASFGFDPLETPALEYEDILTGKYGTEGEQLMYRFEDNGRRRVAMRYDQTVPLARIIAQYGNQLPMPFKRYQIQPVWRADKPQKGRYREFIQCDLDTVGTASPLADAEIITAVYETFVALGFSFRIFINSRPILYSLMEKAGMPKEKYQTSIQIIDKLDKVSIDLIDAEFTNKGFGESFFSNTMQPLLDQMKLTWDEDKTTGDPNLDAIYQKALGMGIPEENLVFAPHIARGLDYYTGLIFEVKANNYAGGSLGGGGRYDTLIELFSGKSYPAIGVGLGFDRIIDAMTDLDLFPKYITMATATVLITNIEPQFSTQSLTLAKELRNAGINCEVYIEEPKEKNPLEKQLKYAVQKNIAYLVIIGEKELAEGKYTLKNLQNREQEQVTTDTLLHLLKTQEKSQ